MKWQPSDAQAARVQGAVPTPTAPLHTLTAPPTPDLLRPACLGAQGELREQKNLADIKGKSVMGRPESKSRELSSLARPTVTQ